MPVKTKHIVVGALACVSLTAATLYWQYKKLMEYAIKFAGIKIKKAQAHAVDFDITLTLTNNSGLKFDIISQEYKVYVNDILISEIANPSSQHIAAKSVSPITVNVKFNPVKVGNNIKAAAGTLLNNVLTVPIRIDIKLKVGLWFIKVNIPYTYKTTLKELLTPAPPTQQ